MKKKLGQVSRTKLEDIYVSLRELQGAPHVDLRVYRRPVRGGDAVAGMEGLAVPLDLFTDLLRVLEESRERLAEEGLLHVSSPDETPVEDETVNLHVEASGDLPSDRRGRRVPLRVPVACSPWPVGESGALAGVTGDVSVGGAQLWLPECLALLTRIEVLMQIKGLDFKELAEVVGVGVRQTHGKYRHSVRWLELSVASKDALSKVIKID
ncbi:MAG: PilZ domain-containing protein [Candidatus Methylomirabilales bacterium]